MTVKKEDFVKIKIELIGLKIDQEVIVREFNKWFNNASVAMDGCTHRVETISDDEFKKIDTWAYD